MLVFRLFFVAVALLMVGSGLLYLLTRRTVYLNFSRRVGRLAMIVLLVFALFFLLEHYGHAVWQAIF